MALQTGQFVQGGAVAVLDALGDAISIQDADFRVIYQNPRHIQLMGDQLGKYCYEGYHQRDTICPECHLLAAFREGKVSRTVTSTKHSQRGLIYVEIISSPLKDSNGTVIAGIETVRDITEHKLMDDKLQAITSDLEQKTWKLMAANKELESFSYTLSHDMRNYLSRISLATDALTNMAADLLDEAGCFLLGKITEACAAMDETIGVILRLSVTDRGEILKTDVDLGRLAEEVGMELRCQHPHHPVEFSTGMGLVVRGDRQLLKLLLNNLLGNAWKYTEGVPVPEISLTSEEHDGKTVFVVRDNGRGFDMAEADRLFHPFSRLSSSAGVKGSGIGLATVRKIILSHGGEIWGEGMPGRGAAFYFVLPK